MREKKENLDSYKIHELKNDVGELKVDVKEIKNDIKKIIGVKTEVAIHRLIIIALLGGLVAVAFK